MTLAKWKVQYDCYNCDLNDHSAAYRKTHPDDSYLRDACGTSIPYCTGQRKWLFKVTKRDCPKNPKNGEGK